jgi:hypothetical protein
MTRVNSANDDLYDLLKGGTNKKDRRFKVRKTAQETLLYLGPVIANKNQKFYPTSTTLPRGDIDPYPPPAGGFAWKSGYKNITPVVSTPGGTVPPDAMVGKLQSLGYDKEKFFSFEITPAQMAELVPKIRIYKRDYKVTTAGAIIPGSSTPREIVFEDAITDTELDILKLRGGNIGSAGIQSFDWAFKGVNPAEVDSNIEADLKVYFNNVNVFADIITKLSTSTPTPGRPGNFIDLITFAPPTLSSLKDLPCTETSQNEYFEIEVEVGWELSDKSAEFTADQRDHVKKTTVSLFLTLTDHKFDFKEDGSATLEAHYRARSTFVNKEGYNLLGTSAEYEAHISNIEAQKAVKKAIDPDATTAQDEEDDANQQIDEYQEERVKELKEVYRYLVKELINYNLYVAHVPNLLLLNGLRGKETAGGGGQSDYGPVSFEQLFELMVNPANNHSPTAQTARGNQAFYLNTLQKIENAYNQAMTNSSYVRVHRRHDAQQDNNIFTRAWSDMQDGESSLGRWDDLDAPPGFRGGNRRGAALVSSVKKSENQTSRISFFYLGDIIELFMEVRPIQQLIADSEFALLLTDFKFINYFKVIQNISLSSTGTFSLAGVNLSKVQCDKASLTSSVKKGLYSVSNIANIPVSADLFLDWMTKKIIAEDRDVYYLDDFLRDLFNDFIRPIIGNKGVFGAPIRQPEIVNVPVETTNNGSTLLRLGKPITPAGTRDDYGGPYEKRAVRGVVTGGSFLRRQTTGWDYRGSARYADPNGNPYPSTHQNRKGEVYITEIEGLLMSAPNPIIKQHTKNTTGRPNAIIKIVGMNMDYGNYDGNYANNLKKGISNFIVGLDRGIVKNVSFQRVDQPYLRESRTSKSRTFAVGQLRELYNVTLELYGNNLFKPGSLIYVEPNPIVFGRPTQKSSVARVLGMGGYHLVVDVSNEISAEGWTTTVKALHVAMPSAS